MKNIDLLLEEILCIVVIYNVDLVQSQTLISLDHSLMELQTKLDVIIYDNSKNSINDNYQKTFANLDFDYFQNNLNPGIATAYNYGLFKAQATDKKWLLLLDHDTKITTSYFTSLLAEYEDFNKNDNLVAVIPKLICNDTIISPTILLKAGYLKNYDSEIQGYLEDKDLTALNSCTMIKVSFLSSIEGFNESYPLDFLDHWLFRMISRLKRGVHVLDCYLEHELSVMDVKTIDINRYKSIIEAEAHFIKKSELNDGFKKRILLRCFKLVLMGCFHKAWLNAKNLIKY